MAIICKSIFQYDQHLHIRGTRKVAFYQPKTKFVKEISHKGKICDKPDIKIIKISVKKTMIIINF